MLGIGQRDKKDKTRHGSRGGEMGEFSPPFFWAPFFLFSLIPQIFNIPKILPESRGGAVVRTLASHQCGPGFDSQTRRHVSVEFVVGSLLCSERFFSGYSGFPLSSKTNISKFQFDPGMHGHFWTSSCELLGAPWVNKFHFLFFLK